MQSAGAEPLPVLVVDDDSALTRTLADILQLHGYAPSVATTGKEGLVLAEQREPALAVIDLRLPDMDGLELAARLHELSRLTEVVVLTGNASVESAIAALREHSVDYLVKPVNVDRLLQVASLSTERWQRRHAEERLRDADERFRRVVESDMLGIMFWDADGAVYDANDAFLRIVGRTRADLERESLDWSSMTPAEYAQQDQAQLTRLASAGVIAPYEKAFLRADGSRVDVLIGAATLKGKCDHGVAFVLDITGRRLAEQAAELRANQQAAVAHLGQHALVSQNYDTLFEKAVALVAQTLELPLVGCLERRSDGGMVLRSGIGWNAEALGHPVTAPAASQWASTLASGEPSIVDDAASDHRFSEPELLRDAQARSGITVLIPGPVHAYGVLMAHDRTARRFTLDDVHFLQAIAHVIGAAIERHRSDVAFRQSQRMEAVGRLASGVSHDFNNMLAAITGFAELAQSNLKADDPARSDVSEILKAAARATALTRQLLAFSRQQILQPRDVRISDIVVEMKAMICRLVGPDVELVIACDPEPAWVKADPGQIEQVIMNLCVNARDAMPEGGTLTIETSGIELDKARTHEHAVEASGRYVMLAVSDTGAGMNAETKARIFEPFFTTKAPDKGTGLGLATVYGIVKQSGGDIWVYSEPGQGSTFKIFLPRIEHACVAGAEAPATGPVAGGHETVLLADDEDALRRIAARILEKSGYRVLVASNGPEAVQAAHEHAGPIHVLVTDLMMPGLTGPEVAERLRSTRPEMRVLYLSGYTDGAVARDGRLETDASFLQKPFASGVLAQKVREVIDA